MLLRSLLLISGRNLTPGPLIAAHGPASGGACLASSSSTCRPSLIDIRCGTDIWLVADTAGLQNSVLELQGDAMSCLDRSGHGLAQPRGRFCEQWSQARLQSCEVPTITQRRLCLSTSSGQHPPHLIHLQYGSACFFKCLGVLLEAGEQSAGPEAYRCAGASPHRFSRSCLLGSLLVSLAKRRRSWT